jgi:hypothetical protein
MEDDSVINGLIEALDNTKFNRVEAELSQMSQEEEKDSRMKNANGKKKKWRLQED